jgi:hypothetical protein
MVLSSAAQFDTIRSAGFASIGATYATIGTALTAPAVILVFKNATNGDVFVSTDGTNNHLLLPSNSFNVFDIRTNNMNLLDYVFQVGTQFYVKDGPTASTSGTYYIEAVTVRTI